MKFIDRLDATLRKVECFVSGAEPTDPLYVSNRTAGQKIRLFLLIGTPLVVVVGFMTLALTNSFDSAHSAAPAKTAREPGTVTGKLLPDLAKTYRSSSDHDCDISEARVENQTLLGTLRNNSDHTVHVADVVFDITDQDGSQLGAVAIRVENIAPRATADFKQALEQKGARTALVRELHTR